MCDMRWHVWSIALLYALQLNRFTRLRGLALSFIQFANYKRPRQMLNMHLIVTAANLASSCPSKNMKTLRKYMLLPKVIRITLSALGRISFRVDGSSQSPLRYASVSVKDIHGTGIVKFSISF